MLLILQFYVSSFWVWAGITVAISMILTFFLKLYAITAMAISKKPLNINFD